MLKLINAKQTRLADKYTIENEPISALELMERASLAFVKVFTERYPDKNLNISVYCGKGNNGGDGLAISRLLLKEKYINVNVLIANFIENESENYTANLADLQDIDADIFYLQQADELEMQQSDIIIDAFLGSGLNRAVEGELAKIIHKVNLFPGIKVSVDIPSGLPSEGELLGNAVFKADWVITFQRPKLNFLLPVSSAFVKEWKVVNIGLDENFIESTASPYYWFWKKDVQNFIKPRQPFEHKGLLGHALIIAGANETMGAALLCAQACHQTGCGLTSACIPESGLIALNSRSPEIMYVSREALHHLDWEKYKTIGVGPGLGNNSHSLQILKTIFSNFKKPLVLDADALNMLSENKDMWQSIPENSVLTPHMKEFDRLFGTHHSWWERCEAAFEHAKQLKVYIVLKNRYTMIFSPKGVCYFNSSGSPAMASGGMGDVLTGMVTSVIAQGYDIERAVLLAVFCHGYSGEQLAQKLHVVSATSLITQIPKLFRELMPK